MTTSKRVFILRLEGEVFDKIGLKAIESHRSRTNYIKFVLLKNLEDIEKEQSQAKTESDFLR